MFSAFNNRLRQVCLLLLIVLLAILLMEHLYIFMPGFLGAITLYILLRGSYFYLTIIKKWNKTGIASLYILANMILIAIPIYFSIQLLSSKLIEFFSNPNDLLANAKLVSNKLENATGIKILSDHNIESFKESARNIIPKILNNSATVFANFLIMFFILYYMLLSGRKIERKLYNSIPLKENNIHLLSNETKNMIRANAIGIPVLAIIQGIVATIGYAIFGVQEYVLWGFLTGICSLLPVIGTAIIWVPLTAYYFAISNNSSAWGLLIYSVVLTTNIDYVARLTLLKKFMDIHPVVTILGVIAGVSLFGFWGVIFGPLLISYLIVLVKIYFNEFGKPSN